MLAIDDDGVTQAPAPLDLVQAFLNSHDIQAGEDAFSSPERFMAWAAGTTHVPVERVGADELRHAVRVREALRDLLAGRGEPDAVAVIEHAVLAHHVRPTVTTDGDAELVYAATGAGAVVAEVIARSLGAMLSDEWHRLKVCANDECQWAYYDASRNRSGRWCSPRMCGSVMNARAYRARRRRGPESAATSRPSP